MGYGDAVPHTFFGKLVAGIAMLTGLVGSSAIVSIIQIELHHIRGERGGNNDYSDHNLDLNIGIDKGSWSVKVWSKNLLDDDRFSDRTTESSVEGVDNFFLGRNLRPRTYGATVIYTFGAG